MNPKNPMDLIGEALKEYAQGDRTTLYFKDKTGKLIPSDISHFFRTPKQLMKFEKRLFDQAYGNILDVGCGTGNYIPLLAKRGKVLGIDISPIIIDIAKKNGCKNCRVADIFTLPTKKKYDSITFISNNLGIGGTVNKTKKLLRKSADLLKKDGQILCIIRRIVSRDYFEVVLRPVWKNQIGGKFGWIHLNRDFLAKLCTREGLHLHTVCGNQHFYLLKITKN